MKYAKYKVFFKIAGAFSQIFATKILIIAIFKISGVANVWELSINYPHWEKDYGTTSARIKDGREACKYSACLSKLGIKN